jgi:acyl transferase domain-containing protein/acyl carrier protein
MSANLNSDEDANQLRQALAALRDMRARLESLQEMRFEPIAIVGMGCRFPGAANSPDEFWRLLESGRDAVSQVPFGRFSDEEMQRLKQLSNPAVMWGGFLETVDQFDPTFFGIAPREAISMDPQQRLFLEVGWEAIEHAGIPIHQLIGSRSGVFVGVHSHSSDYYSKQTGTSSSDGVYVGTGTAHNVIPGRFSYLFDLHGPSVAIDTACSSSLVAVHLAVQSLRMHETDLCLAGGVNLILSPDFTIHVSRMDMLAPRCRTFDESAGGFVRGEGCGVVVLKRLSDAKANNDHILALIRGSAVNQDGRTNGLTAPNGVSQQAVLRSALGNARVSPLDISYVEAHGTGTSLGDPIEVEAIAAVLGEGRTPDAPCFLGSAKSNIGHLEGAAGIAGLIKTVLSLQHKSMPPVCHFHKLNPHISVHKTFVVPDMTRDWPSSGHSRLAGVSSFGWSGTNAHVVLEEAPAQVIAGLQKPEQQQKSCYLLPVSAHDNETLRAMVHAYDKLLSSYGQSAAPAISDFCFSAAVRHSHHPCRGAFCGRSLDDLRHRLQSFLQGERCAERKEARSHTAVPRVVFVFPGECAHWPVVGRQLLEEEEVFRTTVQRCSDLFSPVTGRDLVIELRCGQTHSQAECDELLLFSIHAAVVALWQSWRVVPEAVVGYGMGEVSAAYCAGALVLEDAIRLILQRGNLLQDTASDQRFMMASGLAPENPSRAKTPARDSGIAIYSGSTGEREVLHQTNTKGHGGQPRRLAESINGMLQEGYNFFMEMSPGTEMAGVANDCAQAVSPECQYVKCMWDGGEQRFQMLESLGSLYVNGYDVDWSRIYPSGKHVSLPSYQWQRKRYWIEDTKTPVLGEVVIAKANQQSADGDRDFDWFYDMEWEEKPISQTDEPSATNRGNPPHGGRWIILADAAGLGNKIAERLEAEGCDCLLAGAGEEQRDSSWYARFFAEQHESCNVIHLWNLDIVSSTEMGLGDLDRAAALGCASLMHVVQALKGKLGKIWVVTRNVQAIKSASGCVAIAQSPAWGFCRVLALEHPDSFGGIVDIGDGTLDPYAEQIVREVFAVDEEDQIVLRGDERFVARLRRSPMLVADSISFRADASYLITGGLGSIGCKLIRWMAEQGARHLVLVGRSGVPERDQWSLMQESDRSFQAVKAIREIEKMGAVVTVERADVGDPVVMAALFARMRNEHPALAGVIHAATVMEFCPIQSMNEGALRDMFHAKVHGAWILHELTRSLELDFFLLFSSAASQLGLKHGAHYAAANHFFDSLAQFRNSLKLPALSINWGEWEDTSSLTDDQRTFFRRSGLSPMDSQQAFSAMSQLLALGIPRKIVAHLDAGALKSAFEASGRGTFLADLVTASDLEPDDQHVNSDWQNRLTELTPEQGRELIARSVLQEVAQVLGMDSAVTIDPDRGLFDMGMDSLMSLQLRKRLEALLCVPLPKMLTFNYPSANALTDFLYSSLVKDSTGTESLAKKEVVIPETLLDDDEMSDERARELLLQELSTLPPELTK